MDLPDPDAPAITNTPIVYHRRRKGRAHPKDERRIRTLELLGLVPKGKLKPRRYSKGKRVRDK